MLNPAIPDGPPATQAHLMEHVRRAAIENQVSLRRALRRVAFRRFVSEIRHLCAATAGLKTRPNMGERPVPADFRGG
jgi:hypothetical protein